MGKPSNQSKTKSSSSKPSDLFDKSKSGKSKKTKKGVSKKIVIDEGPVPLSESAIRDFFPNAIYIPREPFATLEFGDVEEANSNKLQEPGKHPKKNQPKKSSTAKGKVIKLVREELEDGSPSPISSKRVGDLFRSTEPSPKNVKENPD